GNDQLEGGAGNDRMTGGAGNDVLIGGLGRDVMVGSEGADRFDFNSLADSRIGAARDVAYFDTGDTIDLSTIDADADSAGNQAFAFIGTRAFSGTEGDLRFSRGVLQADTNGDRVADLEVRIVGTLTSNDLVL
ncbi:MAG TPA: M10 family metallopeptidase C-terminal domain-containing protein, partial [Beijerinckiaceae bacterium]|nr:M10 family metallopeptidase C-terminal domain-containing protein [Beijerinckiaceae bacterium]